MFRKKVVIWPNYVEKYPWSVDLTDQVKRLNQAKSYANFCNEVIRSDESKLELFSL